MMKAPNGFNEIIQTFGDIRHYISTDGTLSPTWQTTHLVRFMPPFSMVLAWEPSVTVHDILCHELLATTFVAVFDEIAKDPEHYGITAFGGCFAYRPQRNSATKLSTHAWGIAIDLNPLTNEQGAAGDMSPSVVQIFKDFGFAWGGDWIGKIQDCMHFQYCTGY